jgi:autotransporter-associated beta strand protein
MKRLVLSIAGACLLALLHLIAADGIWINPGGGLWSAGANWSGGNVAAGVDATANFSTVNLTGNTTVTLDTARTIGHLIFGDTAPSHNWILSGANTLTLDVSSGVPLINVVNQTATINSVIGGNDGFQKIGTGALVLTATNTVSGPVTFSGGTTTLNTSTGKLNGATSINIESGAKLVLDNSGAASAAQDLTDRLPSGVQLNMKGGEYSFLGANIFNNGASFQTLTEF